MRTLKTFIIAASLFLFATPAMSYTSTPRMEMPFLFPFTEPAVPAAIYLPEMPDIENAEVQFVCKTPSLWFLKLYLAETWRVIVLGRNKREMVLNVTRLDGEKIFMFIPTTGAWENVSNLKDEKINELLEKTFGSPPTDEDKRAINSCAESKMSNLNRMFKR